MHLKTRPDYLAGMVCLLWYALMGLQAGAQSTSPAQVNKAEKTDKVLHYAFEVAESTLDPQKSNDVYSSIIVGNIFDAPLAYDYLARPLKLIPNTLAALPEISADGK